MLEVLIIIGIVVGAVVGAFVGLVVVGLFMLGVGAAIEAVLNALTRPRNRWRPPEHQIEEGCKIRVQRIRKTMAYGAPVFGMIKKKKGS